MKVFLLLSCLTITRAYVLQDSGIIVNGVRHQREILYDNLITTPKFVVDYTTNNLFFYTDSRIARFNLNTKDVKYFKRQSIQCLTINQENHDIYIGTPSAIYKYSQGIEEAEYLGAQGVDVWQMYFKRVIYYNKYNTGNIYMLVNGYLNMFIAVESQVKILLIDDEDYTYYSSDGLKLYSQKQNTKQILYDGTAYVTALATDKNGKVYFCADDGIYEVNKENATVNKIVSTVCYYGLAFDSDNNIVYSDHYKIIRLKPIEETEQNTTEIIPSINSTTATDNVLDKDNQLMSLNDKIDKLMQTINDLQTAVQNEERKQIVRYSHTFHLDSMKNVNITLSIAGEAGSGVDQATIVSFP